MGERALTKEDLKRLLLKRFSLTNFTQAKEDVIPFLPRPELVAMWVKEFFIGVTEDYF